MSGSAGRGWPWLALALAGCGWGTSSPEDFARDYPFAQSVGFEPAVLSRALAELENQVGAGGKPRVSHISIYGQSIELDAQDPNDPTHLDRYSWSDGHLGKPSPRPATEAKALDGELFDLGDAPLADIRPFVKRAFGAANVEEGSVSGLSVGRGYGTGTARHDRTGPIEITVSVSGPRRSAVVALDREGNVLRVN